MVPVDADRQREITSGGTRESRLTECLAILQSNLDRFTELANRSFDGCEVVNAQGVVEWEDAVTKEIASYLVDEFIIVRDKIVDYSKKAEGTSTRTRS